MKNFTPAKLIGVVGLLVVATAAGTAVAAPPQAAPPRPAGSQQTPTTCQSMTGAAASEATNPTASGDPYGPETLVADALSKVCMSDDQRAAIDRMGKDVSPKERAVANARHSFVMELAEQLRSGTIDDSALKPQIDALVKARDEASPILHKALDDLHGILDSGQRAAFVDALEARMKEIRDASGNWLDSFAKDLGLSDDQKLRMKQVLAMEQSDLQVDRDRTKAIFDAFKGDDVSIDKLAPESDVGPRTRARAEEMVAIAKQVASILTPEQRSRLADKLQAKREQTFDIQEPSTQDLGTSEQGFVVRGGGFRVGAVRGWGGGYARGWGYGGVRTGYVAGYPFIGGYGPGIW